MTNQHVFINGFGISSAVLALALLQKYPNIKLTICESSSKDVFFNGADLLKPSGISIIKELGLFPEVLAMGVKRNELNIYYSGDELIHLDYSEFDDLGYFILIPYSQLLKLVRKKVQDSSRVSIFYNTTINKITFNDEERVISAVHLSDESIIYPDLVIGADGALSYIRKQLGILGKRHIYDQIMYVSQFPLVDSVRDSNKLYVEPNGGVAYFYPINNCESRIVLGFPKQEGLRLVNKCGNDALMHRLMSFVNNSCDALNIMKHFDLQFKRIPVARMHVNTYHRWNAVLIGDALHNINPITGQGMNLAIEDAGALANILAPFFANPSSTIRSRCFQSFQSHRFPINHKMINYGDKLATAYKSKALFLSCFNPHLQGSSRLKTMFS